MKVKAFLIAAFAAVVLNVSAATSQNDGVITVKVNKASKVLVERWIEGYKAVNPNVQIALVSGKNADADLTLVTRHQEGVNVTYVGRYALLPVTSTENPLLSDIQKKEWKSKDIKSLFFTAEDLDEEYEEEVEGKKSKLKDKLTVYSGSGKASLSGIFASHFGRTIDDIRGNRIAGDDLYLLNAISEDKASVTFNALSNLYDLSSRTLRSELALLPLGAFLTSLFVGWFVDQRLLRDEFTNQGTVSVGFFRAYQFSVRFIVPLCIVLIFLHQFGLI